MTTFTYTNNVPNPPNSPSVDVVNMQINTNSTSGIIAVDHVGFGVANGGTHNQSTYNTLTSGNPTTSGTQGAVYTNTIGSDIELMYVRQNSSPTPDVVQLTGPGSPNATFNGSTFLPGGILLQWGFNNALVSTTTLITFPIPFPNNIFVVFAQPYANSALSFVGQSYGTNGGTTSDFQYYVTSITNLSKMTWWAIGN